MGQKLKIIHFAICTKPRFRLEVNIRLQSGLVTKNGNLAIIGKVLALKYSPGTTA